MRVRLCVLRFSPNVPIAAVASASVRAIARSLSPPPVRILRLQQSTSKRLIDILAGKTSPLGMQNLAPWIH